ncbi:MAG TPA: Ig-like domain-containing protein [Candidatus Limnocylindria bacterium]|nr:Ig-like domain-containing protein [Candidatus Limnocylindria bacterium]
MRNRFHVIASVALATVLSGTLLGVAPAVAAAPLKVVIIVGPTGSLTSNYRSTGNSIADVAAAAGAEVVKVYSPRATWARVRDAVEGANVVIYLGHGNGYPSPYSSTEWTDRVNGWGLNRTTTGGDSDDWSKHMVYCGQKALLGTLTTTDGAAQWRYCGGASGTQGIHPAASWVMIYNKACYAPGASEGWDVKATESVAFQRVRNYSYPALKAGGGAYFATDMYQGAETLVSLVLAHRDWTFGAIAEAATGYDLSAQRRMEHADLSGRQVWIQRTPNSMGTDYWYAYAGDPNLTPSGAMGVYVPPAPPLVTAVSPAAGAMDVPMPPSLTATFDQPVTGVNAASFLVRDDFGLTVPGTVSYSASTRTATFRPTAPLEAGMPYTASLTKGIKSNLGARLARYAWSFSVQGPTSATTTLFAEPQQLVLEAGTNTRYLFTRDGVLRGEQTATLPAEAVVSTSIRRVLPGQSGSWFYIGEGTWAHYWVRESSAVHLADAVAAAAAGEQTFTPPASVRIKRGTHTGYSFDGGVMTSFKTMTLTAGRLADASELRSLPGQAGLWFHMTSGNWSGRWLRASDVVYLE